MKRLSSNLTIIIKIFIPVLYLVFFGSFWIATFIISSDSSPLLSSWQFIIGYTTVFWFFILFYYFKIFKINRVDANGEYFVVSNYVKSYQYNWEDVKKVKIRNYGLFRTIRIYFIAKTTLGKYVSFLPSPAMLEDFVKTYPEIGSMITDAE